MTFLDLCQAMRRRAGISGQGPVTVDGQKGEYERIVDWVRQAWLDLQGYRYDWRPLWASNTIAVAIGQNEISLPTEWSQPIVESFSFAGDSLRYVDWRHFPGNSTKTGTPSAVSRRPDGKLQLWPTPDAAGDLTFEFFKTPQVLTLNADEPWLPDHQQDAIIFQAMAYYAVYEDAPEVYADSMRKVEELRQRMVAEQVAGLQMADQLDMGKRETLTMKAMPPGYGALPSQGNGQQGQG